MQNLTDKGLMAIVSIGVVLLSGGALLLLVLIAAYNDHISAATGYLTCAFVVVSLTVSEIVYLFRLARSANDKYGPADVVDISRMNEQLSRARTQQAKEFEHIQNQGQQQSNPAIVQPEPAQSPYEQQVFRARDRAQKLLQSGGSNQPPKMLQ